jgi:hypothetical protein
MLNVAVIVAVTLVATVQARHDVERSPVTPPSTQIATSGPYQKLFKIEPPKPGSPVQVMVIDMSPRVERGGCNMPIIVAHPEIDPKSIVTLPESARGTAKIRAIDPPPPCGQKK